MLQSGDRGGCRRFVLLAHPPSAKSRWRILLSPWCPSMNAVAPGLSGTEATMSAIRLARGYTGRDLLINSRVLPRPFRTASSSRQVPGADLGNPSSGGVPADLAQHTLVLAYNGPRQQLADAFATHGGRGQSSRRLPVPQGRAGGGQCFDEPADRLELPSSSASGDAGG